MKIAFTSSDPRNGKLMGRVEATERAARHPYSTSLPEGEWSFALLCKGAMRREQWLTVERRYFPTV